MLNWLNSKTRQGAFDHPLGGDAAVDEALASLNPGRAESNLIEIAEWIGDPDMLSASMPPEAALRALTRVDEAAQAFVPEVWKQFLHNNKLDHIGEQKLKSLDGFYAASFAANRHALRLLIQKPAIGGKAATELATRLSARMLHAHGACARIMHLRYRAPDLTWWDDEAASLALVGQAGSLNLKQRAYADDPLPTTPWVEHLIGLFFETAPLGNCNPRQMDLLFRVLRWLEPHFMVRDSFSPQAPWLTRLDASAAPKRLREPDAAHPDNIYFGPGMAYGHLVRQRAIMKAENALPTWMRDSQCGLDEAMAVIDGLIMHWSERPPQRVASREARQASVRAVHGFTQIRRMIAFSEFARSGRKVGYTSHFEMFKFERMGFADATKANNPTDEERWAQASPLETIAILETAGDKQMMDEWQMQDVSETGVGAIASFLKPWMVIGAFIGYRLTDEVDWRIGILRRIHRKDSGHPSLGIESFPETPLCAQVSALTIPPGSTPAQELARTQGKLETDDAIIVSQERGTLLLPVGLFAEGRFVVLSVGGHREVVRLIAQTHVNEDCECVQYEVLEV
jgi:hypothetical protein